MNVDTNPKRPLEIERYLHCRLCVMEAARPAKLACGLTAAGQLQVYCERHRANVGVFDLHEPPTALPGCEGCASGVPHSHGGAS